MVLLHREPQYDLLELGVQRGAFCSTSEGVILHPFRHLRIVAVGLAVSGFSLPVAAQDEASDEEPLMSLSLEELLNLEVEFSGKRTQSIRDVPGAVMVIPREEIAALGYTTLEEALANLPHFYVIDDFEDLHVGVRGVAGAGIQFLINGVPVPPIRAPGTTVPERSRLNIPIEAIDRIEVLRGPKSVAYGNNAFAAVVNIVTDERSHRSRGSLSGGNNGQARGFARGVFERDDASLVLNVGYLRDDGISGDLESAMSPEQLAALHPEASRSLDGFLRHRDFHADVSARVGGLSVFGRVSRMNYGFYPLVPPFDTPHRLLLASVQGSLQYDRELNEQWALRLTGILSEESFDYRGEFALPGARGRQTQRLRRAELELTAVGHPTKYLSLTAGYRFQRQFDVQSEAALDAVGLRLDTRVAPLLLNDIFVDGDVTMLEGLKLHLGARLAHRGESSVHRDLSGTVQIFERDAVVRFTPLAGFTYDVNREVGVKAIYSEAVQNNSAAEFDRPEHIRSVELVGTYASAPADVTVSLFGNEASRLLRVSQTVDPATGTYLRRQNDDGRRRSVGVEADARVRVGSRLSFDASFTAQSTEDVDFPDIKPGWSPVLLAKGRASYSQSGFTGSVFGSYVGAMKSAWQWTDMEGVYTRLGQDVPGYFSLGANLRYQHDSGWYANLHGSNLLDQDIRTPAGELVAFDRGVFGRGREVLLTLGFEVLGRSGL